MSEYIGAQLRAANGTGSTRVAGLDGVRGAAVAAVVVFHAFPDVLPGGFVGVDMFFVLSGFLITRGLLADHQAGELRVRSFYLRRARRLLPGLLLLLVLWTSVVSVVGGVLADGYAAQVGGALTFTSNWTAIAAQQDYFLFSTPPLLQHLWSLAVEEQFYLLWPWALLLLLRLRKRLQVGAVLLAAALSALWMALSWSAGGPSRVYYGTDTHAFGLLLGAVVAIATASLRPIEGWRFGSLRVVTVLAALAGLAWCALQLTGTGALTYHGGLLAAALFTGLLLAALCTGGAEAGALLDLPPFAELGRRSYGIYLWHWPCIVAARLLVPAEERHSLLGVTAILTAVSASLICAWVSYRLVEAPALRPRPRTTAASRRKPVSTAAALLAVAVASVLTMTGAIAARPSAATAAEHQIRIGQEALRHRPLPQPHPAPSTRPRVPDGVSASPTPSVHPVDRLPRRVTAVGDSVMLASAPAVLKTFPEASIDAHVSRQARAAPALLRALATEGRLADVVIVGLGTNGSLGTGTLDAVRAAVGKRRLVLVNVWADRPWSNSVNQAIGAFAAAHHRTVVADWHRAIAADPALLGADGIHPRTAGTRVYARTLAAAVREVDRR